MQKRSILLLLLLIVLLILNSCSMDTLTDIMKDMGTNVAGDYINTESANKAKDAAQNAESEEVKVENGKATITLGGKDISLEIGDTTVSSMLSGISDKAKDDLITQVVDATTNEKSKENLINTMKEPVPQTQTEAAKGTATIVSEVLKQATGSIKENSNIPEEAKKALDTLSSSMDSIKNSEKITAGDVVALQMMTSLVEKVADSTTIEDGEIKDFDMSDEKISELVSEALQTVTVVQAISSATQINLGDFTSILDSFNKDNSTTPDTRMLLRSVDEENKNDENIELIGSFTRALYDAYLKMFPNGVSSGNEINTISLHRNAIEIYVNFNRAEISTDVCNIDSVLQYAIATIFSEASNQYATLANQVFIGDYPKTLDVLINKYVEVNPWIANRALPVAEIKEPTGIEFKDGEEADFKSIFNPILNGMTSSAYVIKNLANQLNLDNLDDVMKYINQLPEFCETGLDYEWK